MEVIQDNKLYCNIHKSDVKAEHIPKIVKGSIQFPKIEKNSMKEYFKALGIENKFEKECFDMPFNTDVPTSLFFQTINRCFSYHYNLILSPELFMHIICSEIAKVINKYPDIYRDLFTNKNEKTKIIIVHDNLIRGNNSNPWHEVMDLFSDKIKENVINKEIIDNMLPDLSTHTKISKAASIITVMDAVQSYYEFMCFTRCGFPEIRMAGKSEDWKKLADSVENLSVLLSSKGHLNKYFTNLIPVLKKLYEQSYSKTDKEFWENFYHLYGMSGGPDIINGWILNFINTEEKSMEFHKVDSYINKVPFIWNYLGNELNMNLVGGCLNVKVIDNCLKPELDFAIVYE